MNSTYITIFIGFSVFISLVYIAGYKKNIKLMKSIAETMENAFSPKDKTYTYLGGVLGFSVEYEVDKFNKVMATLRLIPRQSALYLPFMFLTSGKDSLQILFYTQKPVKGELHIIRKTFLNLSKPHIYNKKLKSKKIEIDGVDFEILFEKEKQYENFTELVKLFNKKHINHLAITKKHNVVYINLLFWSIDPNQLQNSLKKSKNFILNNI